jgi:hypothetical protein
MEVFAPAEREERVAGDRNLYIIHAGRESR